MRHRIVSFKGQLIDIAPVVSLKLNFCRTHVGPFHVHVNYGTTIKYTSDIDLVLLLYLFVAVIYFDILSLWVLYDQ